jgi:hypothetical protein
MFAISLQERARSSESGRKDEVLDLWQDKVVDETLSFDSTHLKFYALNPGAANR